MKKCISLIIVCFLFLIGCSSIKDEVKDFKISKDIESNIVLESNYLGYNLSYKVLKTNNAKVIKNYDDELVLSVERPSEVGIDFELVVTFQKGKKDYSKTFNCFIKPLEESYEKVLIKDLENETLVGVSGKVFYVLPHGYWINSNSNSVFIVSNNKVKIGEEVFVVGNTLLVNEIYTITSLYESIRSYSTSNSIDIKKIDFSDLDISNILNLCGKYYSLDGIILEKNNSLYISSITNSIYLNILEIYLDKNNLDYLYLNKNKIVNITFLIHEVNINNEFVIIVTSSIESTLTNEEKLEIGLSYIENMDKNIYHNTNLPLTHEQFKEVKYIWTSTNTKVISSTGVLGSSTNFVEEVDFSVVVSLLESKVEVVLTFNVYFLRKYSIYEVNLLLNNSTSGYVKIEGKVISFEKNLGIYVADESGVIFINTFEEYEKGTNIIVTGYANLISSTSYRKEIINPYIEVSKNDISIVSSIDVSFDELTKTPNLKETIYLGYIYKLNGYIVCLNIDGEYKYYLKPSLESEEIILIYTNLDLGEYENTLVSMEFPMYEFNYSDGFRIGTFMNIEK